MYDKVNQNSKRLSELSVGFPSEEDYLIFERKDESGNKTSYRIKYSDFKKNIISSMSISGFGDMVHCQEDDFSKFAHGHDYSNFDFFPSYGPNSNNPKKEIVYLGKFKIENYTHGYDQKFTENISVYTIQAKDIFINELSDYQMNHVGDVKFIAVKEFQDYLQNYLGYNIGKVNGKDNILLDEKFDGWVLPNGTTYNCNPNEFSEACKAFSTGPTANSFTVPNIGYFLRAKNTNGKCEFVQFKNALQKHGHKIKTDYTKEQGDVTIESPPFTQTSTTNKNDAVNRNTLHGGKGKRSTYNLRVEINEVKFENTKISSVDVRSPDGAQDVECYPTHKTIPCLIYIGQRT